MILDCLYICMYIWQWYVFHIQFRNKVITSLVNEGKIKLIIITIIEDLEYNKYLTIMLFYFLCCCDVM